MQQYRNIIYSYISFSTIRMLVGASSTIYMLVSGVTLFEVGIIKSGQAIFILLFGFVTSILSDLINRKIIYVFSILFAIVWLFFMYLGGEYDQTIYFYIAELFNAISLCFLQNNSNAYLIDQFYKENPKQELNKVFGSLNFYSFLGMAFASLFGGVLYNIVYGNIFLYTSILLIFTLVYSLLFLPSVKNKTSKNKKPINIIDFLLIIRKIMKHRVIIAIFILVSLYFQVLIQYWQPIISINDLVLNKEYLLGIVLFCMMISQSISGKVIEKNVDLSKYNIYILLFSTLFSILAIYYHSFFILAISLCFVMFSIRYITIYTDTILHRDILSKFRAKYDMVLNTIVRLLTAFALFLAGILSELYTSSILLYIGMVIILLSIAVKYILKMK